MNKNKASSEHLILAKSYPYLRPKGSYLLESNRIIELKGRVLEGNFDKYIPVLAYGSNAAPEQLRRKLNKINSPLAVLSASIRDFDVVYAAKFSNYGSIPATLAPSKGTVLQVSVVLLNKAQLSLIHKTEFPDYVYGKLNKPILIDRIGFRKDINTYFFNQGYQVDGHYISYDEILAENRKFLTMEHEAMLSLVNKKNNSNMDLDEFILSLIENRSILKENNALLKNSSKKINIDEFEQILPKK